jgi:hypothetical protein
MVVKAMFPHMLFYSVRGDPQIKLCLGANQPHAYTERVNKLSDNITATKVVSMGQFLLLLKFKQNSHKSI